MPLALITPNEYLYLGLVYAMLSSGIFYYVYYTLKRKNAALKDENIAAKEALNITANVLQKVQGKVITRKSLPDTLEQQDKAADKN